MSVEHNTTMQQSIFGILAALLVVAAAYEHVEHHAPIPYKFEYGVKDPHTGDHKSAWEHGDGHGGVKGKKRTEKDS